MPPRQKGRQRDLSRKGEKKEKAGDSGQYIETTMRFRIDSSTAGSLLAAPRTKAEDEIFNQCELLAEMR